MKPEELRIGNWVRHYSSWSYRQPNQGPMEEFDFQWDDSDWYAMGECTMEIDKITPIEITSEWLLKFGLKPSDTISKSESFFYCYVGGSEFHINPVNGVVWIERGNNVFNVPVSVDYIHQLQNLYYALTGKELMTK